MHRYVIAFLLGLAAASATAYAVSAGTASVDHVAYARSPAFGVDAWTPISVGASSAVYIGPLTTSQRWILQCPAGAVYFNHSSASSGHDADSDDGYLPAASMLDTIMLPGVAYISLLSASGTVSCRYAMAQ